MIPIKKYNPPTNFVNEPYGTIWAVENENEPQSFYVQVSTECDTPRWVRLGTLLETVYKQCCMDDMFLEGILHRYKLEIERQN